MHVHHGQDQDAGFPFLGEAFEADPLVLQKRERRLLSLVTASLDAVYRMSADWSEMHQLKLSLEAKQFIAETTETTPHWLQAYIYVEDQAMVLAAIQKSIRTKSMFELEHRVLRVDGSIGWTLSRALPLMSQQGEIIEWFGMATDVTDRKLAQELEREKEDQLRQVMDVTTDGVFSLNRDWTFTYLNRAAREMLDASHELIGHNYWETYPENNTPGSAFYVNYHRTMDEGLPGDFTGYYPEPHETWFQAIVRPSLNGITVFLRDVTATRRATEALIQSEKLAAMGRLAASIAHEVNNPLEAVTNLIYLARTSESPSMAAEYLDIADRELSRAAAITNQTLRFYKHSANPTEVNANDIVHGLITIQKGRFLSSNIHIETRLKATAPVFCFDGEIRQVLNNLVGNASDAMQKQMPPRRLLLRTRDGCDWRTGRRGLVFTIADTGPGMSPKTLRAAFEAFYTTKGSGGTGLGLWVSKEIITRHRGELRLRSSQVENRSGTVFTLFLPYDAVRRSEE